LEAKLLLIKVSWSLLAQQYHQIKPKGFYQVHLSQASISAPSLAPHHLDSKILGKFMALSFLVLAMA